jgi:RNA-directed DNA polymerase
MTHWNPQRYLAQGENEGINRELLDAAVEVGRRIQSVHPDLPVLFTLKHLSIEAKVPYAYLRGLVSRRTNREPYKVFTLRKRDVGHSKDRVRVVVAAEPLLLRVQRWIHENILTLGTVHDASAAYRKKSSIVDTAAVHCQARWLIKLDVANFFDSILEPRVYRVFLSLGYEPLLSLEMARLCTRLRNGGNPVARGRARRFPFGTYIGTHLGHLPQGAASSPLLANLASYSLDVDLQTLADEFQLRFTRYADDITFSSRSLTFSRNDAEEVVRRCYAVMTSHALWPNRAKTNIVSPSARKVVLGLVVNGSEPKLSRDFKDRLRMHIHYLSRSDVGPARHAQNRGFDSVVGLQHHVLGLAAYAMGVERKWGADRMAEIKLVNWPTAQVVLSKAP